MRTYEISSTGPTPVLLPTLLTRTSTCPYISNAEEAAWMISASEWLKSTIRGFAPLSANSLGNFCSDRTVAITYKGRFVELCGVGFVGFIRTLSPWDSIYFAIANPNPELVPVITHTRSDITLSVDYRKGSSRK